MICKNKILSKGGKRIFVLCMILIFLLSFLFLFFEFYFEFYQKEKEYSQMLRIENNGERYGGNIKEKYMPL